ncbi:helix-turn-helix domain-containing protein [Amycolatopsis vancoresmycina]|uniref:AraC family transcriptional regulator n=1 Tax=Amycolatopsis vancoresmycina DSM 44592 TaxID=1292037 RepID=R1FYL2_9PSEU|nr:helix-turn-helix domain-containing protein [Amycolatopsis vancoresmycina]EOD64413.1 AraC family transcriptional regulator [Amycolatopsis vancoresmycina DSM 44592]
MYEETAPPRRLREVARCLWRSASEGPKRIVPDGCVDLVAGDGEVFVAGPDTMAWSSAPAPALSGVRFRPGHAAAVLGVAADELRDRRVPLGELWGRPGELAAERVLAGEWSLAEAVAWRLPAASSPDAAVTALIARLDAGVARVADAVAMLAGAGHGAESGRPGSGGARAAAMLAATDPEGWRIAEAGAILPRRGPQAAAIAETAAILARPGPQAAAVRAEDPAAPVAVSERRLRRRFVQAVGYGPATYLRVSRFQRAVALAPRVSGLAALAAATGYADQAHLSRDCRALTGLTPRAYFRRPSTVDVAERDRLRSA